MDLNEKKIESRLSGFLIGRKIHFLEEVDSTNTYAAKLVQKGATEGEVVIADCQTRGRGRMDREWHSPSGKNLFTSIILKPPVNPSSASQMTLMAGVAVAELISEFCPGRVTLKWPNDVLIDGKKVCGILTEMKTKGDKIDYVIVGIGININMERLDFPEELQGSSTSLKEETAEHVSRTEFAAGLYNYFEKCYHTLTAEGFDSIRDRWMKYSGIIGREIEVRGRDSKKRGRVVGLDNIGALMLYDEREEKSRILSGDITVIGD